jgi:hypothetical protein
MNLNSTRAKTVIAGIFDVLDSGVYIDRAFIVRRFVEGGYCERLAERGATALIAANTDIQHHSRWAIWGIGDRVTYSFNG